MVTGRLFFSRRGAYLALFGVLQIALGLAVVAQAPASELLRVAVERVVPAQLYGPLSIGGGLFSVTVGVASRWCRRTLTRGTVYAFGVLEALVVSRALAHTYAATVAWRMPDLDWRQQAALAVVYVVVAGIHLLIATWPEPPSPARDVEIDRSVAFTEQLFVELAERIVAQEHEIKRLRGRS